jgi:hypothetical protein
VQAEEGRPVQLQAPEQLQLLPDVLAERVLREGARPEFLIQRASGVHMQRRQENQIGPDLVEQLRAGGGILHPFLRPGCAEDDVGGEVDARRVQPLQLRARLLQGKALVEMAQDLVHAGFHADVQLVDPKRPQLAQFLVGLARDVFDGSVHGDGLDLGEDPDSLLRNGL